MMTRMRRSPPPVRSVLWWLITAFPPRAAISDALAVHFRNVVRGVAVTTVGWRSDESNVAIRPDDASSHRKSGSIERVLAMLALVLLGPRYEFHYAFLYVLVLISPLWIGAFGRFRLGRLVAFVVLITVFWGYY